MFAIATIGIITAMACTATALGLLIAKSNLYPLAWLRWRLGVGGKPVVSPLAAMEEEGDRRFGARVMPSANWRVELLRARTAWENRPPGPSTFRITALDDKGDGLVGVKVAVDTMPSVGMMYEHIDVWGVTGDGRHYPAGYIELNYRPLYHQGGQFRVMVEDEVVIEDLTTVAVPWEYPTPPGSGTPTSWRPTSGPGLVSYDVVVVRKPAWPMP